MVKLTKTQIENKIIQLIQYNDFEQLELFLQEQPEANLNGRSTRKYCGFLSWAIQNKSKECFDLILSHPTFTIKNTKPIYEDDNYDGGYQDYPFYPELNYIDEEVNQNENSDDEMDIEQDDEHEDELDEDLVIDDNIMSFSLYSNLIGYDKAIEMYTRAPNIPNSYYLIELIKAKILLEPEQLIKLEPYNNIYNLALQNVDLSQDFLFGLLHEQMYKKSLNILGTWNKLKQYIQPYHFTNIICNVIRSNSNSFLQYLLDEHELDGIDLIINKKPTDILTFFLSNCYYDLEKHTDTLNIILKNVKANLNKFQLDSINFFKTFLICYNPEILIKYYGEWLWLPVNHDFSTCLTKFLQHNFQTELIENYRLNSTWYSSVNLICRLGWCKSNPFDFTNNNQIKSDLKSKVDLNYYSIETTEKKKLYVEVYKKFAYILVANGFEPTPNAKETMSLLDIKPEELSLEVATDWVNLNLEPIKKEEQVKTSKKKPASKSKKQTTVKVQVNVEIDV